MDNERELSKRQMIGLATSVDKPWTNRGHTISGESGFKWQLYSTTNVGMGLRSWCSGLQWC
jgi:hypothetical protein